ncbi:response regulator transcription factor [Microbacterium imperiale]|uniref:DNA-binding response regulator n=1 Tax=Microbacterium imperiale TaxID=33884 RepID=A0A9W6M4C9_9MICO|nr:response regulator transcription factor [Microbacterium imperiale]MBP2421736.1 DNA-binding NarL/FixJ family response regulator [Microbacterium imperiale]MDS0199163.1 response regulator transcription factor [Microbacterium imperiale]BFE42078.1 response regulator transcription factor [Microbacterium imperiale]GLJ81030.1 DNA-binding response regulator [Microbacterium imperiale]
MNRPSERIRVLIADDNRAVRRGLRLQLEGAPGILVAGEVSNGVDAVHVARAERADVVLMDIQMPQMSGLAATRVLARPDDGHPPIAVIVMTSYAVDGYVSEALDSGAVGYLLKSHDSDQLVGAIYAAARGEALVSSRVTAPLLREFVRRGGVPADPEGSALLTSAERRVISVLAGGVTSNEGIAETLQVSVHTVRSQLHSALKKLDLADRTQLALWGARNRI